MPNLPRATAEGAFTYHPAKYSFCLGQMTIPLILFKYALIQRSFLQGGGVRTNKTIAISALALFTKATLRMNIFCKYQRVRTKVS